MSEYSDSLGDIPLASSREVTYDGEAKQDPDESGQPT